LKVRKIDLATHDIGNMVDVTFATEHRCRIRCFVFMVAPDPGVGPWKATRKKRSCGSLASTAQT